MRIIAGRYRGHALLGPLSKDTRPTGDRTRESIFSMLDHQLRVLEIEWEACRVLDVFAGTGALGFEALSRGAPTATFLEKEGRMCAVISENARKLKADAFVTILKRDALKLESPQAPYTLIFMDAPYGQGLTTRALQELLRRGWLAPKAILVIEVGAQETPMLPLELIPLNDRTFGAARVLIARRAEPFVS